jgi:diguanylate cyclase (GGDEF)-like protein
LRSGSSDLVSVSCLVLDVDHFKKFNDRFGHEAGDAVLRQVGGVLKNSVRGNTMAFRFGGEEFVVLIADTDSRLAVERAEHIRRQIAALDLHHDGDDLGTVTVSIGVANAPEHASVDRLVGTADAALLRAKQEGRDRVVLAATRRSIEQSAG